MGVRGGPGSASGPRGAAGTGVHPNLLPWERQRLVAAGRGGCSSPEILTKGRGKGARLRQGRPRGAASTPSRACGQHPLSIPQRGSRHSLPNPTLCQPLSPHPAAPWLSPEAPWAQAEVDTSQDPVLLWQNGEHGGWNRYPRPNPTPLLLCAPITLSPWLRTPLAPTNIAQHINVAFSFILKVDINLLNQRAPQSLLRSLAAGCGEGWRHPILLLAPGWRRALT